MTGNTIKITLTAWRQAGPDRPGAFETYDVPGISPDMSFLEMLDVVNERLTKDGKEPIQLLVKKGMFAVEAEMAADRLVEADLRGIHSHGSRALPRYIKAMDDGNIDPRASITTLCDTPAMAVLDGNQGMGHVVSTKAMQLAIKKAKAQGASAADKLKAATLLDRAARKGLIHRNAAGRHKSRIAK
mgnify:CR=1 FL=1